MRLLTALGCTAMLTGCAAPAGAPQGENAQQPYRLEPFVWIPSLSGDVPDSSGGNVDVNLLGLDDLEYGMMFALEVDMENSEWTLLVDSLFARFDDDEGLLQTELDARVLEVIAAYQAERGIELLAGLRYWNLDVDVDLAPIASRGREESWVDPVVGVRGSRKVADAWSLHGRADVGGFGLEADWAYQLKLHAKYGFGPGSSLEIGYRHLFVEFDDFDLAVALTGPLIGVGWSF